MKVSSATVRNEIARLEEAGYTIRPHHAAGCVPSEKGYRYYVETLVNLELPLAEQRMINHLFHQVEGRIDEWLGLATVLVSQMVHNVAIATMPRATHSCRFKHFELVSLKDSLALVVLVLQSARVEQQLLSFDNKLSQIELTAIANKFNHLYDKLSNSEISSQEDELSENEQLARDCLVKLMCSEDAASDEPCLEGLHFFLSQPEFSGKYNTANLIELAEHRRLLKSILPNHLSDRGVHVIIGEENENEDVREYSIVLSQYGVPDQVTGTIGVVGPKRLDYLRAISTVDYLSLVLSSLVAEL